MKQLLVRGLVLSAIYLLVLTSLRLGDVIVALALGFASAAALRPEHGRADATPAPEAARQLLATAVEMVRGSWQVVRFCLGRPCSPGFVEVPRDGRSRRAVARWTILTGVAPGEVVVDVEEEDDPERMLIHVIESAEPDRVRARHRPHAEVETPGEDDDA
ncbi:hypothetical protein HJD18_03860 [Thermoleophilia bacterium SCSIO 60948]|nr:hypothetical protein HJD18_03860 [Thermoleophilia bacterium SCSIO 60948]